MFVIYFIQLHYHSVYKTGILLYLLYQIGKEMSRVFIIFLVVLCGGHLVDLGVIPH